MTVECIDADPGVHTAKIKILSNDPKNDGLLLKAVATVPELPRAFGLKQNYPNPFNPSTTIAYSIPEGYTGSVSLRVYDIRGSLVRTLVEGTMAEGNYSVSWDGKDRSGRVVSSGIYFYRLEAGGFAQVRKMLLLK